METNDSIPIKPGWIWKLYLFIYFTISLGMCVVCFAPSSPATLYYQILLAFNIYFLFPYSLQVLSLILNLLTCLPVYLFVYQIDVLRPKFWRMFLLARLAAEIFGHSYEYNIIKAAWVDSPVTAANMIISYVMAVSPSYIVLGLYAFRDHLGLYEKAVTPSPKPQEAV
ncbi:MAG: hypothetical protein Q8Q08_12010 [Candidatus Omnitrophota bacterium]|nr:hypothetical protein [Candidatus Omnitrophota bacterium]MDZ4241829.1 hypothetical protein [Candidatus Omnitrophota bacterium]